MTRWREVHVLMRTFRQPLTEQVGFMRAVVVQNQMHVQPGGDRFIDRIQEFAKLYGIENLLQILACADSIID